MIASSAAAQAPGRRGDGGPATQAPLRFPASVAALPDGGFVIADSGDRSIRRVTAGGVISTVARGLGPVGVPLVLPTGVAPLGNGDLVVADPGAQAVWRIAPDGSGVRFAGTGTPGFSGDGGRATDAALDDPVAVSVTPGGAVLIADRGNDRIRRVALDQTLDTVVGGAPVPPPGTPPAPDASDVAATAIALDAPSGVAATPDGGFLVADTGNNVVRRVSYGAVVTVAGTGDAAFTGDGNAAPTGSLATPAGVAALPDGGFAFADHDNHRIREVTRNGLLDTVAGTGDAGLARPLAPAGDVDLAWPTDVDALPDGGMLVADTSAHVILRVLPGGASEVVAGITAARPLAQPLRSGVDLRLRSWLVRRSDTVRGGCRLRMDYSTTKDATATFRLGSRRGRRVARTIAAPSGSVSLPTLRRRSYSVFFRARRLSSGERSDEDRATIRVTARCR